ncbi:MAG: hemerythrin [Deltaproteobacteria bacterium]|nr:hemerythrin [Deltaproteobacteria bacterium]
MEQSFAHNCGCGHGAVKPTEILSDEHRVIERVLSALEALTRRPIPQALEHWQKALDFIRCFADQCHHFKEEQVLFPAMEERGIPKEGGPIGMMLLEHEEGRGYVRAMAAALEAVAARDRAANETVVQNARAYIRLLREHIQKEDQILYPMAENAIPAEELEQMRARFAEHEAAEMGAGTHERYLTIARDLETALGL